MRTGAVVNSKTKEEMSTDKIELIHSSQPPYACYVRLTSSERHCNTDLDTSQTFKGHNSWLEEPVTSARVLASAMCQLNVCWIEAPIIHHSVVMFTEKKVMNTVPIVGIIAASDYEASYIKFIATFLNMSTETFADQLPDYSKWWV